ncbi:response regulator transcription factor [Streptomyces sp. NPDC050263]|uniref:helix-turn-helix transcriptional regulator n=1 Tax=Streptomyces sp. NPDC050263 TaxID=3155037 RepID=UPI003435C2E6
MESNPQSRTQLRESHHRSRTVTPSRGDTNVERPPTVAVRAGDPVTREGVIGYLRSRPQVEVLGVEEQPRADVLVILADDVISTTLAGIKSAALEATNPEMRIVLVANSITEIQLTGAISHGLVSFLPRRQTEMHHILAAILSSRANHAYLPATLVRRLVEAMRILQSSGAPKFALTEREIDIIRLLSEGWTTEQIADKLGYSDRTIKNSLHTMLTRLGLRNRAHAVGYGARLGIL